MPLEVGTSEISRGLAKKPCNMGTALGIPGVADCCAGTELWCVRNNCRAVALSVSMGRLSAKAKAEVESASEANSDRRRKWKFFMGTQMEKVGIGFSSQAKANVLGYHG